MQKTLKIFLTLFWLCRLLSACYRDNREDNLADAFGVFSSMNDKTVFMNELDK